MVFDFVVAAVLIPLGAWLALAPATPAGSTRRARLPRVVIGLIAAVAGCVGGIYGIGGGSILAPILIADGQPPSQVAPAALSSTFLTSVAGVVTFSILSVHQHGSVAPNWPTGIALGAGGLAGGYVGARLHARMPETIIRRLLAFIVVSDRHPLLGGRPDRRSLNRGMTYCQPPPVNVIGRSQPAHAEPDNLRTLTAVIDTSAQRAESAIGVSMVIRGNAEPVNLAEHCTIQDHERPCRSAHKVCESATPNSPDPRLPYPAVRLIHRSTTCPRTAE